MILICDPFPCAITIKIKILQHEVLVEVIWVCKVNDSCKQTLDSFNKSYLFNDWLNKSSIMIYWRLQITTLANKWQFSCIWQIVLQSPFQCIYFPSYASERTLNSSHGENARLSKFANRSTSNFFLVTFVQLWRFPL